MKSDREAICPYCDSMFQDSWDFDEDESVECDECGKLFELEVEIETTYTTYSNCSLNGEEHDWVVDKYMTSPTWIWYGCTKCDATKMEDK